MALTKTYYGRSFPAFIKGLVSAYSVVSDPLVTSGLLNNNNTTFISKELSSGVSIQRSPAFSAETRTDPTTYNRADFAKNVVKTVTMPSLFLRTSHSSNSTYGAVDDPQRLASIINDPEMSDEGAVFLAKIASEHAKTILYNYIMKFMSQLYNSCQVKSDYDSTTGPSGATLTFSQDVPHADATQTADLSATSTDSIDEQALTLLKELYAAYAPIKQYAIGSPVYILLPVDAFNSYRLVLEYYKSHSTSRRADDEHTGGTFNYSGIDHFTYGDMIFVSLPSTNFPTSGVGDIDYDALMLTPDAIRVIVSTADLISAVTIADTNMTSMNIADPYNMLLQGLSANPNYVRVLNYMGVDRVVGSFMNQSTFGGTTLPNLVKLYTTRMPSGTATSSEYYYTRAELSLGVLRANPSAIRKFIIPKALI